MENEKGMKNIWALGNRRVSNVGNREWKKGGGMLRVYLGE